MNGSSACPTRLSLVTAPTYTCTTCFWGISSRLLSAPLVVIYHLARLSGAVFMLYALYRFCMAVMREARLGWLAFALAAFGAGLGWLGLPLGMVSADFWVAEAYPFLSAYTNAHFPLTLGILLWILTPPRRQAKEEDNPPFRQVFIHSWFNALLGFALALVSPFAVAIALVVCLAVIAARRLFHRLGWVSRVYASRLIWVAAGSLPVLAYDLWAFSSSPQLSAWNAQNITPALPAWDVLLSFSPVLLLAFLAAWRFWRERKTLDEQALDAWLVPLAWALTAMILVYLPFNLQRRFIVGLVRAAQRAGGVGIGLAGWRQAAPHLVAGVFAVPAGAADQPVLAAFCPLRAANPRSADRSPAG